MKKLLPIITALFILIATTCEKSDKGNEELTGNVAFSFNENSLLKSTLATITDAKKIIISIENESGAIIFDFKAINLFRFNNVFLSEPIALRPGNYKVTTFFVVADNDSILYLTPREGSELAYLVADPLPVNFSVLKDQTTKVAIEVISATIGKPEDFGYATFSFNIIDLINFCISVFGFDSDSVNFVLTETMIKINSEDGEVYSGMLPSETNNIQLPKKSFYHISIQKTGYSAFDKTISIDSLINYNCSYSGSPLIVILEKIALSPNIVAYYPFNGNALDESGNNYNGTVVGASLVSDRFGVPNSAYSFNGVSDYIFMGDILDDVTTGPGKTFSFSLWMKRNQINTARSVLLGKTSDLNCDEDGRQYTIQLTEDNRIQFVWNDNIVISRGWRIIIGSTVLTDTSKWYHIAVTYDGNIFTGDGVDRIGLYINGEKDNCYLKDSHWGLGDIEDGPAHFGVGAIINRTGQACGNFYFKGILDDVIVFDKVLSEDEVNYGHL